MNYIKKIESLNKANEDTLANISARLDNILAYLNSPKFRCGSELDGYVSVQDIILRLREIRSELISQ